jgi:hypothetical protein
VKQEKPKLAGESSDGGSGEYQTRGNKIVGGTYELVGGGGADESNEDKVK